MTSTNYSGPWMYQQYTSAMTCVNQVPATFKTIDWVPGTVNLDYGGGRFETATKYLRAHSVTNLVYDPYNRSDEHNAAVLALLLNVKADTATLCNVLNVIKEWQMRQQVLRNIHGLVKPGGLIYISCYRGRDTEPSVTSHGWQENRPPVTYLSEVQKVFPDAILSGRVIYGRNEG